MTDALDEDQRLKDRRGPTDTLLQGVLSSEPRCATAVPSKESLMPRNSFARRRGVTAVAVAALAALGLSACGGTKVISPTTPSPSALKTESTAKLAPTGKLTIKAVEAALVASDNAGQVCNDIAGGSDGKQFKRDLAASDQTLPALLDALQQDPTTMYVSPNPGLSGTKYVSMAEVGRSVTSICGASSPEGEAITNAMP